MHIDATYDSLIKNEDSMFLIVNNIAMTHDLTQKQVIEKITERHRKSVNLSDPKKLKNQLKNMLTTPRLRNVNKQIAWWLLSEIET